MPDGQPERSTCMILRRETLGIDRVDVRPAPRAKSRRTVSMLSFPMAFMTFMTAGRAPKSSKSWAMAEPRSALNLAASPSSEY